MPDDSYRESSCEVGDDPFEHNINPAHAYNSEYNSAKSPLGKRKSRNKYVFQSRKLEELKQPQSQLISNAPKDAGSVLQQSACSGIIHYSDSFNMLYASKRNSNVSSDDVIQPSD